MLLRSLHLPLFSYLVLSQFCGAQDVTVDDQGDNSSSVVFDYSPPSKWVVWPAGNSTPTAGALHGTLHSCSWEPTDTDFPQLTVNFSGTAVNLVGVLQQNVLTSVDIAINGTNVTRFSQIQDSSPLFHYNISFYSNSSLPLGNHTLTVSPAAADSSVIFVDYLTFTPGLRIEGTNPNQAFAPPDSTSSNPTSFTPSVTAAPLPLSNSISIGQDVPTSTFSFPPSQMTSTDSPAPPSPSTTSTTSTTSSSAVGSSGSQNSSALKQNTLSPTMMYLIIASSAGGAILFSIAVALCLICRARRARKYKAVPHIQSNGVPLVSPNTQEFGQVPPSVSSLAPLFPNRHRSDTNLTAPSPTIDLALSSDFHDTPTLTAELEGVFRQLEEISLEVETLQARNSFISISASTISASSEDLAESELTPTLPRVLPLQMRGSIDRIRNEVERLRRQSSHTLNELKDAGSAVVTQEMLEMLQDLALLRAEVEDMLADQMREGSEVERLPSYRSARSSPCPPPIEPPPPLPSEYAPPRTVENN